MGLYLEQITLEELADKTAEKVLEKLRSFVPKPETPDSYLTRKEASKRLKVSLPTLAFYCQKGLLPSYRIGSNIRFKQSEIEQFLDSGLRREINS